jgi:hypothetical protein
MSALQGSLLPVASAAPLAPQKRRLAPGKNDPIKDLVVTPDELAQRIVDYFRPAGVLLDPARGTGPFFRAMQRYSNDVRWCEKAVGVDFFDFRSRVDWIITNPPFSQLRQFARHAMTLAPNVVFTGTVQQFTLKARLRDVQEAGYGLQLVLFEQPPPPWPGCGFQPAVGYLRKGAPFPFDWLPRGRIV